MVHLYEMYSISTLVENVWLRDRGDKGGSRRSGWLEGCGLHGTRGSGWLAAMVCMALGAVAGWLLWVAWHSEQWLAGRLWVRLSTLHEMIDSGELGVVTHSCSPAELFCLLHRVAPEDLPVYLPHLTAMRQIM